MNPTTTMKIGQLSKATGKTARTLHFYEELGLLRPAGRTKGGFRLYSDDALTRIKWIERLQSLGFSLSEVQEFLESLHEEQHGPDAMGRLAEFYADKLRDTEEKLARLQALRDDLHASMEYLAGCRGCDPLTQRTECSVCDSHPHDEAVPDMVAAVHQS